MNSEKILEDVRWRRGGRPQKVWILGSRRNGELRWSKGTAGVRVPWDRGWFGTEAGGGHALCSRVSRLLTPELRLCCSCARNVPVTSQPTKPSIIWLLGPLQPDYFLLTPPRSVTFTLVFKPFLTHPTPVDVPCAWTFSVISFIPHFSQVFSQRSHLQSKLPPAIGKVNSIPVIVKPFTLLCLFKTSYDVFICPIAYVFLPPECKLYDDRHIFCFVLFTAITIDVKALPDRVDVHSIFVEWIKEWMSWINKGMNELNEWALANKQTNKNSN